MISICHHLLSFITSQKLSNVALHSHLAQAVWHKVWRKNPMSMGNEYGGVPQYCEWIDEYQPILTWAFNSRECRIQWTPGWWLMNAMVCTGECHVQWSHSAVNARKWMPAYYLNILIFCWHSVHSVVALSGVYRFKAFRRHSGGIQEAFMNVQPWLGLLSPPSGISHK